MPYITDVPECCGAKLMVDFVYKPPRYTVYDFGDRENYDEEYGSWRDDLEEDLNWIDLKMGPTDREIHPGWVVIAIVTQQQPIALRRAFRRWGMKCVKRCVNPNSGNMMYTYVGVKP